MKVFDLNVVRRLKLPTEAIQLIIQYLQEAHPTARFIKSVNFKRFPTVLRVCGAHMRMHRRVAVWNHPPLLYGLCVRHVRLRKDPDDDEAFASFRFNPKTGARERHGGRFTGGFILVKWPWGGATWLHTQIVWRMERDPAFCLEVIVESQPRHYENEMWDWNLEHVRLPNETWDWGL